MAEVMAMAEVKITDLTGFNRLFSSPRTRGKKSYGRGRVKQDFFSAGARKAKSRLKPVKPVNVSWAVWRPQGGFGPDPSPSSAHDTRSALAAIEQNGEHNMMKDIQLAERFVLGHRENFTCEAVAERQARRAYPEPIGATPAPPGARRRPRK